MCPPVRHNSSDIITNLSILREDQANCKEQSSLLRRSWSLLQTQIPSTMVYAQNRNTGPNDNPRGDAIAVFALDCVESLHFRQDGVGV